MDSPGVPRVLAYQRPSPDASPDAQHRAILEACAQRRLRVPATTYTDAAGEAREFRTMLGAVGATTTAVTVVVASLEVFGARVRDQAARVLQLEAGGVTLVVANLDNDASPEDALVEAWRDRKPGERRRESVRESMRRLALRGRALGRPPYGYRVEDGRLQVEPAEAEVVREIFRLCVDERLGVRRISALLNERALPNRRGGTWTAGAIRDILRNPSYTGTYRRLDVLVPRAHEAIITKSRFDEAQRLMADRRTAPSEQRRFRYLLSGLARCGYCGNSVIGLRRPGRGGRELVYYQCESAMNEGRCDYHTRRAEELERVVRRELAEADYAAPRAGTGRRDSERIARIEARRRALHRDLDRMLERRATGQWTSEQFRTRASPVALDDLEAEAQLDALVADTRMAGDDATEAARRRLVEQWPDLRFEERRELLERVVAEIVVRDDSVRIVLAA